MVRTRNILCFRLLVGLGVLVSSLFASCAKEAGVSSQEIQNEQLDAYMQLTYGANRGSWPARADMGYYYIPLGSGTGAVKPVDDNWVQYDVTATYQDKTVYFSTSAQAAKAVNGFSTYIHYIPEYFPLGDAYNLVPKAIADAMKTRMKEGDTLRLIMTPDVAGTKYLAGVGIGVTRSTQIVYNPNENVKGGSTQTFPLPDASKPVVFDIVLRKIIANPSTYEQSEVLAYRDANYPGLDSTKLNFFFKELTPPTDTVVVKDGYTVKVQYTGRFLDGYVFDTSSADTAKANNIYVGVSTALTYKAYQNLSFEVGSNTVVKGFNEAVKHMKAGSSAVVFFTSDWGYGIAGKGSIQSYTPLQFYITLVSVTKKE